METAVCYLCDVLLKVQLTVKVYAKISNNFLWLDDVATDRQANRLAHPKITWDWGLPTMSIINSWLPWEGGC